VTRLDRYVQFWARREPPEALALIRILVAAVILFDLLEVARLDLIGALWAPIEEGGIGPASYQEPLIAFYRWFGASTQSARLLFATTVASSLWLLFGCFSRFSALLLMLLYAELSRLSPDADRGIDVLLRNVLAVLACSDAGAIWSIDAWRSRRSQRQVLVPAWPRYLLIVQLVLLYFWAGMLKQSAAWTSLGGYSALFLVLNKPHYARFALPHGLLSAAYPLLQVATLSTIVFERSAPLIPLLMWLRATRQRGGKLREWLVRAHVFELWVGTGAFFHLSLAAFTELGIFPWGCLALYPVWFNPETLHAWCERWRERFASDPARGAT
jgi:hypothetical protein